MEAFELSVGFIKKWVCVVRNFLLSRSHFMLWRILCAGLFLEVQLFGVFNVAVASPMIVSSVETPKIFSARNLRPAQILNSIPQPATSVLNLSVEMVFKNWLQQKMPVGKKTDSGVQTVELLRNDLGTFSRNETPALGLIPSLKFYNGQGLAPWVLLKKLNSSKEYFGHIVINVQDSQNIFVQIIPTTAVNGAASQKSLAEFLKSVESIPLAQIESLRLEVPKSEEHILFQKISESPQDLN